MLISINPLVLYFLICNNKEEINNKLTIPVYKTSPIRFPVFVFFII
jgi:hypothetical protein